MGFVSILKIELHPWCQQKPIVEYCRSKGIIIQAYCPLVRAQYFSDPTLTKIAEKVRQVLFFFFDRYIHEAQEWDFVCGI